MNFQFSRGGGLYIHSCILAISLFVCIAAAQQQATPTKISPAQAPVCTLNTTKPLPEVKKYSFSKANSTNQPCIVAQFSAYMTDGAGNYAQLNNGQVDNVTSRCEDGSITPKLVVRFECGSIDFEINHSNNSVFMRSVNGFFIGTQNITITNNTESGLFSTTQSGHYYKCNSEQAVRTKGSNATLVLSNFAYEAYRTAAGTDFYQIVEECALDSAPVSYWVRIGVGICLIGLVAIVLIAYFIGRRRWSERSSYESV